MADHKAADGKYYFLADRASTSNDVALFSFDPSTTQISKLGVTALSAINPSTTGYFQAMVDHANNRAIVLTMDYPSGNSSIVFHVYRISLADWSWSSGSVTLSNAGFYMFQGTTAAIMRNDGRIVLVGATATGDNFNPAAATLLLDPGSASAAPSLNIALYPGLTVTGTPGKAYNISYASAVDATTWTSLTNITLPASPYLFFDTNSATSTARFYRVQEAVSP